MPRNHPFILVTGGCRSGKSGYAQSVAESLSQNRLYIATAQVRDEEMQERVRLHRQARGELWRAYEVGENEARGLWRVLADICRPGEAVLLDCLTLWTAACMHGEKMPEDFGAQCEQLLRALGELPCPVVIVTNEVGMGVVPATPAGRAFRDMAGLAGQMAARIADSVVLVACGLPLALKGRLPL